MTKDEVLEKVKFHSELRGLSKNTQDEYYTKAKLIQEYFNKPATELDIEDIQKYLHHLYTEKHLKSGSINTHNSGIRFLYNIVLDKPINHYKIPMHRKHHVYPDILTREEVTLLLKSCKNIRNRTILTTMYSAGMRLSEVTNMSVYNASIVLDIDSNNMQILIRNGKGNKDRYAILSQTNLEIMREYWKERKPKDWFFTSLSNQNRGEHISTRAVQSIFREAQKESGISKHITCHTLRHSFATHLLEDGVSIFHIKQLLGHANIRTTCIYLHLVKISELNVVSPIDKIMLRMPHA